MILNDLHNEPEIRRFLLGEMREDERSAFEENFVANEDLFEQIRVSEDELIESYICGTLDLSEREKFEKSFLITKNRRQRVAFTREMLNQLAAQKQVVAVKKIKTGAAQNPSVLSSMIEFFKTPKLAFGAAFAILLLAFGFWFLVLKSPNIETDIARQITPTPIVSVTPPNIENSSNVNSPNKAETNKTLSNKGDLNKNQNISNANANANGREKSVSPPTTVIALSLFSGTVRSEGKMSELNLPKDAKGANLQLNLESQDYKTYRAEILDADGNVIYRSGTLNPRNTKINAFVPSKNLKRGDYILKLYGFNSEGEEESAADFQFRVNQK